jgi:hypothetical protein
MFSGELLPIYLNDHLALATAGRDLARRAAGANKGTEIGDFLAELSAQVEADRAQLIDVMARLDVGRDQLKIGAAWLGEKLGRLKLNGRLLEYSPLSRVIEIESLIAGVQAKLALWRTLAAAVPDEPRLADVDFTHLAARAEEQLEALTSRHRDAVGLMLR